MNARSSLAAPNGPRSASSKKLRHSTALLALALLAICGRGAAGEPVTAVWQEREIFFFYRSAISIYSCDALRTRVASILYAVGARHDLQIKVSECSQSNMTPDAPRSIVDAGPGRRHRARPTFHAPTASMSRTSGCGCRCRSK